MLFLTPVLALAKLATSLTTWYCRRNVSDPHGILSVVERHKLDLALSAGDRTWTMWPPMHFIKLRYPRLTGTRCSVSVDPQRQE